MVNIYIDRYILSGSNSEKNLEFVSKFKDYATEWDNDFNGINSGYCYDEKGDYYTKDDVLKDFLARPNWEDADLLENINYLYSPLYKDDYYDYINTETIPIDEATDTIIVEIIFATEN